MLTIMAAVAAARSTSSGHAEVLLRVGQDHSLDELPQLSRQQWLKDIDLLPWDPKPTTEEEDGPLLDARGCPVKSGKIVVSLRGAGQLLLGGWELDANTLDLWVVPPPLLHGNAVRLPALSDVHVRVTLTVTGLTSKANKKADDDIIIIKANGRTIESTRVAKLASGHVMQLMVPMSAEY
eukprot:SAG31_NODE_6164_length_2142_cov_4.426334_1_plen_180_part_00